MSDANNNLKFIEYLQNYSTKFDSFYNKKSISNNSPKSLKESISYINTNGGKRIRPFLVAECSSLFEVKFEFSIHAAIALEMVHTYSLIHDDLPSMDDDDMRRGQKTLHKKFNEAIAILTGDSLLTDAFYVLTEFYKNKDPYMCIELISMLSKSSGSEGMTGGQVLDLFPLESNENNINMMNEMKTGALIKCATSYGAILGKASKKDYNNMVIFGTALGKAFQIRDDLLDIQGDEQVLGKKTNKDQVKGKLTLIDFHGIEGAKILASNYITEAKDIIAHYGDRSIYLQMLTDYIIERKR